MMRTEEALQLLGVAASATPAEIKAGRFGPDATLTLPANAFDPGLSELDDDRALELFCAPNRQAKGSGSSR